MRKGAVNYHDSLSTISLLSIHGGIFKQLFSGGNHIFVFHQVLQQCKFFLSQLYGSALNQTCCLCFSLYLNGTLLSSFMFFLIFKKN